MSSARSDLSAVRINAKALNRVQSGHPWIFRSDVMETGSAAPGEVVRVLDAKGRTVGVAHYSASSQIVLRMLSRRVETIDAGFFKRRIQAALDFRQRMVKNSDAYRLVHAEADLLPGLIVDRYGGWLSVQLLNQGMDRMTRLIVEVLQSLLEPGGIVARNDAAARAKEELPREVKILAGEVPERVAFSMNGLHWRADLVGGQKTGVFLDQRENYLAAAAYANGRVLDCFGGTGGFSIHAARYSQSVDLVDSSDASLETAKENAELNGVTNVRFHKADALEYLAGMVRERRQFETVVVDPPAFTKSRAVKESAMRGYKEINVRALQLLEPGGILISNSCSHHVSEADLLQTIAEASLDTGVQLRILERRTQAPDHPILLTVPETHYLKCLILQRFQ